MRIGVVGLGRMGLSHLAIARMHPEVTIGGVCDSAGYVREVLERNAGLPTFGEYDQMLERGNLDAVIIATPSNSHASMVRGALERGLHVFCEKPFVLDAKEGATLSDLAEQRGLANQVGYHNRFVSSFGEVKRLLDIGAIGEPSHILAEAYGPVVLRPPAASWRSKRSDGGGCLYDYAAHPLNLANWLFGEPVEVRGTKLNSIFSKSVEDEVYATLYFGGNRTAQLSVNWSDESYRKMTTRVSIWGTQGRIFADRQEIQAYLRGGAEIPAGYSKGWNVKYTTELTPPVWYYLRGEEYSAQIDQFVRSAASPSLERINSFASALVTDRAIAMLLADASGDGTPRRESQKAPRRSWFSTAG